jgi:hypothetical protein
VETIRTLIIVNAFVGGTNGRTIIPKFAEIEFGIKKQPFCFKCLELPKQLVIILHK